MIINNIGQCHVYFIFSIAPAPPTLTTTGNHLTTTSSNPVTLTTCVDPLVSTSTGTTTIILPAIGTHTAAPIGMTFTSHRLAPRDPGPVSKRRRVSASSTDSGIKFLFNLFIQNLLLNFKNRDPCVKLHLKTKNDEGENNINDTFIRPIFLYFIFRC